MTLRNSRNDIQIIFKTLSTTQVIIMFSKRIQIAKMHIEVNDEKTIESFIRVGSPTMIRISNWINDKVRICKY